MGKAEKQPGALKFRAPNKAATLALYTSVLALGWLIARDIYPGLELYAGMRF